MTIFELLKICVLLPYPIYTPQGLWGGFGAGGCFGCGAGGSGVGGGSPGFHERIIINYLPLSILYYKHIFLEVID